MPAPETSTDRFASAPRAVRGAAGLGRRVRRHWVVAGIGAVVTAAAATIPVVASSLTIADHVRPRPASAFPARAVAPGTTAARPAGDRVPGCRDVGGAPVDCAMAGAGLWLPLADCSHGGVLAAFGADPATDFLLLELRPLRLGCLVRPAEPARRGGADAVTVQRAEGGAIESSLRTCARTPQGAEVSCATPHRVEYVTPWRSAGPDDATAACTTAAQEYTGRQADPLTEQLSVLVLSRRDPDGVERLRCAVTVQRGQLGGSVRNIGPAELPVAG
jgi:hypothetical protein